MTINKILKILTLALAATTMLASCGSDDEEIKPNDQQTTPPPTKQEEAPTVDESSLKFQDGYVTFAGTRASTSQYFRLFVSTQQDGTAEKEYEVEFYVGKRLFQATVKDLERGRTYWCRVEGYNYKGEKLMETTRMSFYTSKDSGPNAPAINEITVFPPTTKRGHDGQLQGRVITTLMEYSTNNGDSWTKVKTNGSITGLSSGDVLLRYSETESKLAGKSATITIPEHASNTDPNGDGGKSEGFI